MGLLLEIRGGPFAGRRLPVRTGETLLIGRALDRAQFAIPHDNHMSGIHFAVECAPDGCRILDKKSTNGTLLNGGKIQEAILATGDEIKSGQTVFVVRIVPDDKLPATLPAAAGSPSPEHESESLQSVAKPAAPSIARQQPPSAPAAVHPPSPASASASASAPAVAASGHPAARPAPIPSNAPHSRPSPAAPSKPALTIGAWSFAQIPSGWQVQEGLGIQQDTKDKFPGNIGAMEESLGPNITLQQYVEAQIKMFREYLREPQIDAVVPPKIQGAAEAIALEVRYQTKEGQSIYYQRVYARHGGTVGVLTLTALAQDVASIRPDYEAALAAISLADGGAGTG